MGHITVSLFYNHRQVTSSPPRLIQHGDEGLEISRNYFIFLVLHANLCLCMHRSKKCINNSISAFKDENSSVSVAVFKHETENQQPRTAKSNLGFFYNL